MMYGFSLFSDGSIDLFDIKDSMIDCIIEDNKIDYANSNIYYTENNISVQTDYFTTIYFYDKEDRKEMVLGLL